MIPRAALVVWSDHVGWPSIEQVEQDLVLSRLIIEVAQDPYLGSELVFRSSPPDGDCGWPAVQRS